MFPFVSKHFNDDVKLHQDNDPKHNSTLCRIALEELDIKWVFSISKPFRYIINNKLFL